MEIFNVNNSNDSGTGSLRAAVSAANSTPGLDTITVEVSEINLASALLITDSVAIEGSGVVITQQGNDRLFTVDDGTDEQIEVRFNALNLTGGRSDLGGAVFNNENLEINNSSFFGNTATKRGGAIYTEGKLSITGSEVTDNIVIPEDEEGAAAGGGIYARFGGELQLTNSIVSNNEALVGGGIIIADGSKAIVTDSEISNNFGEGILAVVDSRLEITGSTIFGNKTDASGGGVAVQGDSTATIYGSQIRDNYAAFGGGLAAADYSSLEVTSSTISDNIADEDGGVIDLYNNSQLTLVNSTLTGNSALLADGISNYDGTSNIEIIETPLVEEPVVETPVIETPVMEEPVVEEPVAEIPVIETPVVEEPIVETSVVEEPVAEAPVIETPVAEETVIEEPVIETPVVEEPVIETPVVEEPVTEEPIVDNPVVDENTPAIDLVEVHRFYDANSGIHFYSDETKAEAMQSSDYNYEGASFAAIESNTDAITGEELGAEEVYHFYNNETGGHLYTLFEEERAYVENNLDNYSYKGVAYYAFESAVESLDTVPVYRMLNTDTGTHFYTTDSNEFEHIQSNLPHFAAEGQGGVAFHVHSV